MMFYDFFNVSPVITVAFTESARTKTEYKNRVRVFKAEKQDQVSRTYHLQNQSKTG